MTFIDIKALCRGVVKELTGSHDPDVLYIYDYVFLCFFLGNDFLPHFPCLNIRTSGITSLMDAYRKILYSKRLHIIGRCEEDQLCIQWQNVRLFIDELARCEYSLINTEYVLREKGASRISSIPPSNPKDMEEFINDMPLRYRAEELYISPKDYYWQKRYYSALFSDCVNTDAISKNYLEGLEWVFLYYSSGCPHWRWKYKYSYPPLLEDLRSCVLPKIQPLVDFQRNVDLLNMAFSPEMQLAYVLPKPYLELLPEYLLDFLKDKMDLYPETANDGRIRFVWAFCRFFWEAHVILPEIPLDKWSAQIYTGLS